MDKKKIFNWSITVALAGFLFGFDTVVISGANLPIKELWNTSPIFHGVFIMSMALWGTVIGSLFGSIPCDRIGRKNTLIWIGILIAYFSNYLFQGFGGDIDWRYMLGVEAIPAIFYILFVLKVPNSPRWLILLKGEDKKAEEILRQIYPESEIKRRINQIKESTKTGSIFSGLFNFQISLAFLIAFFNQLSGINFVLYYAPEILQSAGLAANDSLMSSVSIGFVNLIFTMFGLRLIDKFGRKYLMKIGSIGYIISLISIGFCFIYSLNSYLLLAFILIFIASHAIGQGTVIWVFISEIFPNSVRAKGQSLGTATHWVFAALITALTPYVINMLGNNPGMIFYFFGFMMILQLVFVVRMMPETKGIALENMKFS